MIIEQNKKKQEEMILHVANVKSELEVTKAIFWEEVHDKFPLSNDKPIGIRERRKVVQSAMNPAQVLSEMLHHMVHPDHA